MDWDLKAPSWDFAEFEREEETEPDINITHFVGSSSVGEQHKKNRGDCSVDLKLGRFGDFGEISMNKWNEQTRVSSMVSSSSSTSPMVAVKRGRAGNNGAQTVSCLVDGCDADLSKCREYHRRHKVCEVHSKTPKVTVGGQEQRFCQQCSRFHMLVEFDEIKRSCRKRLDGHNRRRRKAQPEPLSINSGTVFPYHQGSRFLPYTNAPQIFPSTSMASPTWPGVVKMEEDTMVNPQHLSLRYADRETSFSMSLPRSQKEGKRFPFLQVNELGDRRVPEASVCQPLLNTIASSEAAGSGSKMFSAGFNRAHDSDCALSLLSSPSTQQRSGISISHVVQQQPGSIPMSQPLLHHNSRYQSSQGMNGEPMGSVMVSGDANVAELSCQGIFHLGSHGSSQNGIPQALPFSWE